MGIFRFAFMCAGLAISSTGTALTLQFPSDSSVPNDVQKFLAFAVDRACPQMPDALQAEFMGVTVDNRTMHSRWTVKLTGSLPLYESRTEEVEGVVHIDKQEQNGVLADLKVSPEDVGQLCPNELVSEHQQVVFHCGAAPIQLEVGLFTLSNTAALRTTPGQLTEALRYRIDANGSVRVPTLDQAGGFLLTETIHGWRAVSAGHGKDGRPSADLACKTDR